MAIYLSRALNHFVLAAAFMSVWEVERKLPRNWLGWPEYQCIFNKQRRFDPPILLTTTTTYAFSWRKQISWCYTHFSRIHNRFVNQLTLVHTLYVAIVLSRECKHICSTDIYAFFIHKGDGGLCICHLHLVGLSVTYLIGKFRPNLLSP